MLEKAEKIEQVSAFVDEVHLSRQNDGQKESHGQLPYFLGEIAYRGSFSKDIMAMLSLGQIINVGKGASIGNGMFRIEKGP